MCVSFLKGINTWFFFFYIEQWEYLEEHKDLYSDVIMDEDQPSKDLEDQESEESSGMGLSTVRVSYRKHNHSTANAA